MPIKIILNNEPSDVKEEKQLREETKGNTIEEMKEKLKDKMVTKNEIKDAMKSVDPKKSLLQLFKKRTVDDTITEEKGDITPEEKEVLKSVIESQS